jgi:cell division transport system permease protein
VSASPWVNRHGHALRIALQRHIRQPITALLSALVIACALSLPAGFYHTIASVSRLSGYAEVEPQLSVYLAPEANADDARAVREKIGRLGNVAENRYISRDAALAELKATSDLNDVLAALDHNPLPDVFVVRAADTRPEALEELKRALAALPKVEHVQLDSDWARKLAAFLALARAALLVLSSVLLSALVFVTASTIRLQVLSSREEIEVCKLIGAGDSFVRRPFLYFGAIQGVLGAVFAVLIVVGVESFLDGQAAPLAALYGSRFRMPAPEPWQVAALIGVGAILGWVSAYVSVAGYLRRFDRSL